jgi:hypothetical protein
MQQSQNTPSITHIFSNGDKVTYEPSKNTCTLTKIVNDEQTHTSSEDSTEIRNVFVCEFLPNAGININNGGLFLQCDPINKKLKQVIFCLSDGRQVHFTPSLNIVLVIGKNSMTRTLFNNVTNCRMDSTGSVDWDSTIPPPQPIPVPVPLSAPIVTGGPTIGKNDPRAQTPVAVQTPVPAQTTPVSIPVTRGKSYQPSGMCRYWYETDSHGRQVLCSVPFKMKTCVWEKNDNPQTQKFIPIPNK